MVEGLAQQLHTIAMKGTSSSEEILKGSANQMGNGLEWLQFADVC